METILNSVFLLPAITLIIIAIIFTVFDYLKTRKHRDFIFIKNKVFSKHSIIKVEYYMNETTNKYVVSIYCQTGMTNSMYEITLDTRKEFIKLKNKLIKQLQ